MKDRGPVLQVLGPTGPGPKKLNFRIQGSEIDLLCTAAFQGRKPDYFLAMEAQEVLMKLYTGTLLPLGGFLLKDEDVKKNSGRRTKFLVRINMGVTESRMGCIKVNNLDVYGVLLSIILTLIEGIAFKLIKFFVH
ncbi:hypothetical protein RhiirC2_708723 [Rhizophagus irregularis]|uniref:Uncharacterized protein n=1 Tax=Rhizophagus irregularis TaxID=588596 RepID=A0A2N1NL87_9GLOM|nr:hypothetical protein RhiirC2_708723 [Rhizophagus irregularis]